MIGPPLSGALLVAAGSAHKNLSVTSVLFAIVVIVVVLAGTWLFQRRRR